MNLDAKKRELDEMKSDLQRLEERFKADSNNYNLKRQIDNLNNDITKLSSEVDILNRMEILDRKYSNHEPINFHYVDGGLSDDIELPSTDVNYNRAYQQQRDLLQLEYNHYNKLPISYHIRNNRGYLEGIVSYGNDKYDDIYNNNKNELLNREIISTIHKSKEDNKPSEMRTINGKKVDVDKIKESLDEPSKESENEYAGKHFKEKTDLMQDYVDPGYRLLEANGQIIVVGDIPVEKKNQVLQNLVQEYGQSAVDNMKVYDTETLTNILKSGEMIKLAGSDYYADMDKNGNIGILNNDKVIYVIEAKSADKKKAGAHFKQSEKGQDDSLEAKGTYIGGKHFKPNNLDSEYAVFEKDGYLHVVGNFTSDWVGKNYKQLFGDLINDKSVSNIKIWNKLKSGDTPLDGFDVKVRVDSNSNIQILGDVDNLKYYNQFPENELVPRKEGKHFKDTDESQDEMSAVNDKDMSGLDKIPDDPSLTNLNNGAQKIEPIKGRKITRKEAKPSLIKRGIEKFKGLKKWQKVAIVAGVIAIAGVGIFVVGPHIVDGINHLLNPENANTANQMVHATTGVNEVASQTAQSIDYSSMGGAGHTVFTNAADAANNVNGVVSNQWFSNNPVDVFNTATNSYMGLTPEQLNDPNLLAELAKDPNNAMLFGNSMSDPSGFIGLDDVVNTVTKIR